eukprot:m.475669 g.475669  ORF g.475669 m.475669 type:complete len:323 (+) comp38901_c0_seq1:334-1302(+)
MSASLRLDSGTAQMSGHSTRLRALGYAEALVDFQKQIPTEGSGQAPNPRRELSATSPLNPTESQFYTPPSSWVSMSGVTMVGWGPSSTAPGGPFYYHPPPPNAYRMMSPAMMPPTVSAMPSAAAVACYPPQMHWQPQRQLAGYYPYFPQPKRESPTHSTQLQRRSSVGSLMLSTMSRTEFEGQHQAETDAAPKRAKVKVKGTNAPIFPTEPSPSKVDKVLMTDPATGTAVLIKPFQSKQSASQRAKLAKGKRVYACPFCDHLFSCSSNLIRHKRVHTGDKPYKCTYCDMQFATCSNRKAHEGKCKKRVTTPLVNEGTQPEKG